MNQIFTLQYGFPLCITVLYMVLVVRGIFRKDLVKPKTFILWTTVYVVILRFFDYQYLWSNPDLDQWIVCAKSMIDDPESWWSDYSMFDFTRVLTILPLSIFYWFSGQIGYTEASVFFLVFFCAILWVQVRLLCIYFSWKAVYLMLSVLVAYTGLSLHHDYRVYNSEIVGVFMLSLVFFLWSMEERRYFLLGLVLGLIPFSKEQLLPTALVLYGLMAFHGWRNVGPSSFFKMIFGGFLGGGVWMMIVLGFHGLTDLKWFLGVIAHYSQNGIRGLDETVWGKLQLFLQLVWLNREMMVLFPIMLIGFVVSVYYLMRRKWVGWNSKKWMFLMQGIVLLVSIYLVYTPHNRSIHYNILLWPSALFFGVSFFHEMIKWNLRLVSVVILLVFSPMALEVYVGRLKPWYPKVSADEKRRQWENEDYVVALKKYHVSGEQLLIWGWDNRSMVMLDAKRSCGYLYPQFAFGAFSEVDNVRGYYLETINNRQPAFIIELVGSDRWFFSDIKKYGLEAAFPACQELINKHYSLVEQGMSFKLYKKI